ncbi:hypothetical protein ACCO45_007002 [Purpureocillium lilacinum]|uniref:Uncharacterized protein n=1 Tax=Purpureocillium lilacinum TaxID=33203 RepID=A0ACC4DR34_PURLI
MGSITASTLSGWAVSRRSGRGGCDNPNQGSADPTASRPVLGSALPFLFGPEPGIREDEWVWHSGWDLAVNRRHQQKRHCDKTSTWLSPAVCKGEPEYARAFYGGITRPECLAFDATRMGILLSLDAQHMAARQTKSMRPPHQERQLYELSIGYDRMPGNIEWHS